MPITSNKSNKNIITTKQHVNDENGVDAKSKTSGKLGKRLVDADVDLVNNLMNRQISTSSVESGYGSDNSINNQSIS